MLIRLSLKLFTLIGIGNNLHARIVIFIIKRKLIL